MKFFPAIVVFISALILISFADKKNEETSWIRINLLGYKPGGIKVGVWCSKNETSLKTFQLIDAATKKIAFSASAGKSFGSYGPFNQTYRLNFSAFSKPGTYYLQSGGAKSPEFEIGDEVYKGSADFCLRYMRQQRTGFNPFLKDSCHTKDGYTVYGPMPDSTHVDVVGGWHDASDYLQYSTTSANATQHLLMAYRDFPKIFSDEKQANGLDGKNGMADVLDEAKWGLDWLLKMHPDENTMFNQIADDRDHISMRMPKLDSQYGKGYERPVYFIDGKPQGLFQYKNRTKGTSSTAAKFASAFSLGSSLFTEIDKDYSFKLYDKAGSALSYAFIKPGVTQTAPGRAPYFYEEDNWTDDMELAFAMSSSTMHDHLNKPGARMEEWPDKSMFLDTSYVIAKEEKITPWLGADTARHYQWYPFINLGHYELAKQLNGKRRDTITGYYKEGIRRVWNKAKLNAFYRGIPFIWCSNNLTTSFAIQCYWYKQLTKDKQFEELEQANVDWLFGCNPWGTSMVYGLPAHGDTPVDPHSAFTHIGKYPIDGGLVDGPVYGSIFNNLKGITLYSEDEYAPFQSNLAVYHDDYGDYSTNEPTMDGTASLIYLLAAKEAESSFKTLATQNKNFTLSYGGIIRGDKEQKKLAIVFTGDEFADGGEDIRRTLQEKGTKASFFFTGRFYRNPSFKNIIDGLKKDGHYLGAHSDTHVLYADWKNRNKLLVTKKQFNADLKKNYNELKRWGITKKQAGLFLPPFEWYNDSISSWTRQYGLQLINYSPGTISHADYTTPEDKNYRNSADIYRSITSFEEKEKQGLNGFILLMHIGTDPKRKDKFYKKLPLLITWLKGKGYELVRVDELLK